MPVRQRRLATWIATFAVVLQALWPLIATAQPNAPSMLVPVCTVNGTAYHLDPKPGKTPLDERSATHGEHCKLCVSGHDRAVALPPAATVPLARFDYAIGHSIGFQVPVPEPLNHPPAQSRAPPEAS